VLKNIPACISPDLMHSLMSMGHGDEIVFADADFPGVSNSKILLRSDGVDVKILLNAVLPFFPLDTFVERPVITMDCSEWGDEPESYTEFRKIIKRYHPQFIDFEFEKRFDFYRRASKAFAVVITSESDGNAIIKKGPVMM
jgi:L-fucose mutarotase